MIRAGYLALRRIGDFFSIDYDPNPQPDDFISISQQEFDYGLRSTGGERRARQSRPGAGMARFSRLARQLRPRAAGAGGADDGSLCAVGSDRSLPRGTMYRRRSRNGSTAADGRYVVRRGTDKRSGRAIAPTVVSTNSQSARSATKTAVVRPGTVNVPLLVVEGRFFHHRIAAVRLHRMQCEAAAPSQLSICEGLRLRRWR